MSARLYSFLFQAFVFAFVLIKRKRYLIKDIYIFSCKWKKAEHTHRLTDKMQIIEPNILTCFFRGDLDGAQR